MLIFNSYVTTYQRVVRMIFKFPGIPHYLLVPTHRSRGLEKNPVTRAGNPQKHLDELPISHESNHCWTIWQHVKSQPSNHIKPYLNYILTISNHIKPYQTISNHIKPYQTTHHVWWHHSNPMTSREIPMKSDSLFPTQISFFFFSH